MTIATLLSFCKMINRGKKFLKCGKDTVKIEKKKVRKIRRKENSDSLKRKSLDTNTNPPNETRFDKTKKFSSIFESV